MSDGYFFCFDKGDYIRRLRNADAGAGCVLCRILAGDPSVADLTVYRDDLMAASLNLYPYNPGHILLFPVRHAEDLRGLTPEERGRLAALERHFLDILEEVFSPAGFNLGVNMGAAAGASISHLHEHLVPRYRHETGFSDIIAGRRVLVEDPRASRERIKTALYKRPFSISMT